MATLLSSKRTDNRYAVQPYEAKIAELRSLQSEEARKVQNIVEAKESALREVMALGERKAVLNAQIRGLEANIGEAQEALNGLTERKRSFVNSIKIEEKKERSRLKDVQKQLKTFTEAFEEIQIVGKELTDFLSKEKDARLKYLKEKQKLDDSRKEREEIMAGIKKEKHDIEKEKKDLDGFKTYVSDLYGRLATYTTVARETIEYVNRALKEKDVPLEFGLPPSEIAKVDFNNFDKHT